jgi:Putative auto-transporter adhesin, head GIN domain
MKQKFFTGLLAITTLTMQSFANGNTAEKRKIENSAPYEKIVVGDNLNVMLVVGENAITVEGADDCLDKVTTTCTNGTLTIKNSNKSSKGKIAVYVPVTFLSAIDITGNSTIVSTEIINAPDLKVKVEGDCKIGLQTNGKITLQHSEDYDFSFARIKNPKHFKTERL